MNFINISENFRRVISATSTSDNEIEYWLHIACKYKLSHLYWINAGKQYVLLSKADLGQVISRLAFNANKKGR